METYTQLKSFVDNPQFNNQRKHSLSELDFNSIDPPIVEMVKNFAKLNFCFTQQCCYGHFVYENQNDHHNTSPLPTSPIPGEIEYRIAYIALCLENSENGKTFLEKLKEVHSIDEQNIQIGCADWFWDQQVNSFVLQVEPERFKYQDKLVTDYQEALHLEKIRNEFFKKLSNIITE